MTCWFFVSLSGPMSYKDKIMNVADALKQRKSVRAYLDKAVEIDKINTILEVASHAPSGVNTQPWQVAIVTGNKKTSVASTNRNRLSFR
jgi:nitroreductase